MMNKNSSKKRRLKQDKLIEVLKERIKDRQVVPILKTGAKN
jgi:hypothetical protein